MNIVEKKQEEIKKSMADLALTYDKLAELTCTEKNTLWRRISKGKKLDVLLPILKAIDEYKKELGYE